MGEALAEDETLPEPADQPESPHTTSPNTVANEVTTLTRVTKGTDPVPNSGPQAVADDDESAQELQHRRSATHYKLCAYEAKRRSAYAAKLQSSSLYWRAFRTLMHDSVLETQKADILVRGWTNASETYGMSMRSVGEWCIDEKGVPVTDFKKKKKLLEAQEKGVAAAGAGTVVGADFGGGSSIFQAQQRLASSATGDKRGLLITGDFSQSEKCGTVIKNLADSAGLVAGQYEENVKHIKEQVLPELSS